MRLIDIDNERFWNILFDEACVDGGQAERINRALESIIAYDVDKVVERLKSEKFTEQETILSDVHQGFNAGIEFSIQKVKAGGANG